MFKLIKKMNAVDAANKAEIAMIHAVLANKFGQLYAAILVIVRRQQENTADTWLFQVHSNRAKDKPVSRVSVSRIFKDAGELLGLTINTHSMRKSRGMAMYKDGVPVEKIAKVLNHSNTTSTLRYLGITQEEVLKTYDDYEL